MNDPDRKSLLERYAEASPPMRVDLERLRVRADGWLAVRQPELSALVAVVDAARTAVTPKNGGDFYNLDPLRASLVPFTSLDDPLWKEIT